MSLRKFTTFTKFIDEMLQLFNRKEPVASGVYFYQLTVSRETGLTGQSGGTRKNSWTRRMVVVK